MVVQIAVPAVLMQHTRSCMPSLLPEAARAQLAPVPQRHVRAALLVVLCYWLATTQGNADDATRAALADESAGW